MEPEKTITVRHAPDSHCYELHERAVTVSKRGYHPATG